MKKSRVGSSSMSSPMISRRTSGMAGSIPTSKKERKIKIDSDLSNLKWIEKTPPITMVENPKQEMRNPTIEQPVSEPVLSVESRPRKIHGYEEKLMIPLGGDWINPDILEKYQQEYQLLGERQVILETNYQDSAQVLNEIYWKFTNHSTSNRL